MADPKGYLVVPVGYRADGSLHALELDNSDRLKVLIDSITGNVTVVQTTPANLLTGDHIWDGSAWQKLFGFSSGLLQTAPLPHKIHDASGVTQVCKEGSAVNATTTLYTVTNGKTLYLTSVYLFCGNDTGASNSIEVRISDSTPTTLWSWFIGAANTQRALTAVSLAVPAKVPSQGTVKIISGALNLTARCTFTGYEV